MKIILFYIYLFVFWAEKAGGLSLTSIKGFSLANLIIYMLLFYWAFKIIVLKRNLYEPNNINTSLIMLILVFAFSILIKVMLGEVRNISISHEIIALKNQCDPLLIFFILFNIFETKNDCQQAIRGLLILLVMTLVTTFLVTSGLIEFGRLKVYTGVYGAGRSSGFGNPNDYASYLVLFIPLILCSMLFKNILSRYVSVVLLVMTLVGLIITGSRGGILSFIFSFLVVLWVLNHEKMIRFHRIMLLGPLFILLCAGSYALAPTQVKETLEKKIIPNKMDVGPLQGIDRFTSGRTLILRSGLALFIESPIYGHGQNTFLPLQQQRFGITSVAHNRYLSYMVEYGIIGLAIYIIILIKIARYIWYRIKTSNKINEKVLYISYLAGFCGYTFSLLGINAFDSPFPFWIYTAIIYKYAQIEDQEDQNLVIPT